MKIIAFISFIYSKRASLGLLKLGIAITGGTGKQSDMRVEGKKCLFLHIPIHISEDLFLLPYGEAKLILQPWSSDCFDNKIMKITHNQCTRSNTTFHTFQT